jgi:DedD protein
MENRLKERLTGAAILVALIVMLVPEMFHGQRGDVAARASSSAEGPPVRSYTIDLSNNPAVSAPLQATPAGAGKDEQPAVAPTPDPTPPAAAAPPVAAPGPAVVSPPAAGAAPAAAPAPTPTPAPAPRPPRAAATPPAPAPTAGGWAVQLGLFAKRDNAERLQHAAQAKGFGVSIAAADARGLYRVYAGGLADRAAAESYAQRLKDQGLPAAVIGSP